MTQTIAIRFTFGVFSVSYLLETYLAQILSSDQHRISGDLLTIIFSLFFRLFRIFSLFCLEKAFLFNTTFSSRFFAQFWSFHDLIATRREIIYGHTLGLDQQNYFFERSHWKFRREIGQIENQVPKRENPEKIEKEIKLDTTKIARRRINAS